MLALCRSEANSVFCFLFGSDRFLQQLPQYRLGVQCIGERFRFSACAGFRLSGGSIRFSFCAAVRFPFDGADQNIFRRVFERDEFEELDVVTRFFKVFRAERIGCKSGKAFFDDTVF